MILVPYKAIGAFVALLATGKVVPFEAVDSAYGNNSAVTAPNVVMAATPSAWAQLWTAHQGTQGGALPSTVKLADERPPLDFSKVFVVGIFGGTTTEVDGFQLVEAKEEGNQALVRFEALPMPNPIGAAARVSQPYGFAVLTLTKQKVLVQLPDGRQGWKTVATFDSPVPKKKG